MTDLKTEFLSYPKSLHDDIMDAIYYALKNIYYPDSDIAPASKTNNTFAGKTKLGTNSWWMS